MHNTVSHPIIGKSKGCIALETIIVKDIKHKQQLATFVRKVFDKYQGEKLPFKKKKDNYNNNNNNNDNNNKQ